MPTAAHRAMPVAAHHAAFVDDRAAETLDQLADALWCHAAAVARAILAEPGSTAEEAAQLEISEFEVEIAALERALRERPWIEES